MTYRIKSRIEADKMIEFLLEKNLIKEKFIKKHNNHVYSLTQNGEKIFTGMKFIFESKYFESV